MTEPVADPKPSLEDLLDSLGPVRMQFWVCPVREHGQRERVTTVQWEGDVAHCTADGCELTSTTRMIENTDHAVRHPWPADCRQIQGGKSGLVLSRKGDHYQTAFVEVCPTTPSTFIRGEGETLVEAEDAAWAKWQRVLSCPSGEEHELETRGYDNGAGFCKHCNLFVSHAFALKDIGSICVVCGEDLYGKVGKRMFCVNHVPPIDDMWAGVDEQDDYLAGNLAEPPAWAEHLPDGATIETADFRQRSAAIDTFNGLWLDQQIAEHQASKDADAPT